MTIPDTKTTWNLEADELWQRGDRQGAINKLLEQINASLPRIPIPASLQFAYYLFQLQDFTTAEKLFSDLLRQYPTNLEILENRAIMRIRTDKIVEAVLDLQKVIDQNPNNVNAWDGLAHAYYRLNQFDEAQRAGENALSRKDRLCAEGENSISWPEITPSEWENSHAGIDVIAFSLWGKNPRYLRGALRNLQEVGKVYPGWVCRFYVDDSVPTEFVNLAIDLGAQVLVQPADQTLRQKLSWRLMVANDLSVRRFLVRDADAVVSEREAQAVTEWLASDRWFHVLRDYWTHTETILAGMWGGRAGLLPDLFPLVEAYDAGRLETANIDQWFLRDRVWPMIRSSTLIHDRCFRVLDARAWPETNPSNSWHVGQDEFTARPQEQNQKLGSLMTAYSWLQIPGAMTVLSSVKLNNNITLGYWINLDRDIERRQAMEQQLQANGLTHYQRVSAVDGSVAYSHLLKPGVMGCWLSHLRVLRQGAVAGGILHVMEDDTCLGERAADVFRPLLNYSGLNNYDLVFTDVLFDYLTSQRYFRAFYEAAVQVPTGKIPAKTVLVNLKGVLFTCTNSYFVTPKNIGRVLGLLEREFRKLNAQNPEPIDMVIRRLVFSGELRAAVTCPFLTSINLALMVESSIRKAVDPLLQRTLLLHSIQRQAFFYGADDRVLLDLLEQQFPHQLRTDKSRLMALLAEQMMVEPQQKF